MKGNNDAVVLDGAAVIVLIIFAIAIMHGFVERLFSEPGFVLFVILISFIVYFGLLVFMAVSLYLISPRWGSKQNLSIAFAAGARNLAVILTVLPDDMDPDMLVYFAAGKFPIYIMSAVLKPVMSRLVNAPIKEKTHEPKLNGN